MFKNAITRAPGFNFKAGLTTVDLGAPDFEKTLAEHAAYLVALKQCGLIVDQLSVDLRFPDGTFVEDTAILLSDSTPSGRGAIVTRPGAHSRRHLSSQERRTVHSSRHRRH